MLKRIAKAIWVQSPQQNLASLVKRPLPSHGPYFNYLKEKYFQFISEKYGSLSLDEFSATIDRCLEINAKSNPNWYPHYLWELFEPTYRKDFDRYYKWHEKFYFFRFLLYATNEAAIERDYAAAYRFAIGRLGELDVLEVGGGVPHGLIHNIWKSGRDFCRSLMYIDINVLHADFVEWYCRDVGLKLNQVRVPASIAPIVPDGLYNFIFAKDIFEHLDTPDYLLDQLIDRCRPGGFLALDLEHKGPVMGQHINPNLPPLKERLVAKGLRELVRFGQVGIWGR